MARREQAEGVHLYLLVGGRALLAQLGHANGGSQGCVDTRVAGKLGRQACTAGGAGLLALSRPLVEAAEAEIVLARRLKSECLKC